MHSQPERPELDVPVDEEAPDFPYTDLGNAERLVETEGEDLRFVPGLGWHVYDGQRWRRDDDGGVQRRAKKMVRGLYAGAERLDDYEKRKTLAKWALACETVGRIEAAVSLAQSEQRVIARSHELDAMPFLLNVTNGTLKLRTGELRPHKHSDYLTKVAPTRYDPDATSERWEQFLEEITGGDTELAAFLRRAVGYSLTGDTSEEVLFFAHGPGATGKSTFLEAIRATIGEYAKSADFETFLASSGDRGVRNDVARLAGARFVTSVEVDEGKKLAEGLLKMLLGGDKVSARFLYSETFEFDPAFKLWLAANQRPRVSADDDAMWRRIVQVPFTNVIPEDERDPNLKRLLKTDADIQRAILAWAVRGCLEWQEHGLAIPDVVRKYTAEYRAENDPLADWLAANCHFSSTAETPTADLRDSYAAWATLNNEHAVSNAAYGKALKGHGCKPARRGQTRVWRGVALNDRQ